MEQKKSSKVCRIILFSAAIAAGALFLYGAFAEPNFLVVRRSTIPFAGLSDKADGLKILLVADTHFGDTFIDKLRRDRILTYARQEKADLCLLLGDYIAAASIHGYGAMEEKDLDRFFSNLKAPLGTYGVLGNHELWYGRAKMTRILERSGVRMIENQKIELPCGLVLAGVPDGTTAPFNSRKFNAMIKDEKNLLLLSHKGDMLKSIQTAPENIMFAADTHGGQIRIPGIGALNCFLKGKKEFSPGLSKWWNKQLYITTGAGGHRWGFRLFCPPEIALVTLKKGNMSER